MLYNWENPNWPEFIFDEGILSSHQLEFLLKSGKTNGLMGAISSNDQVDMLLETIVKEAMKTSEIEGEFLSRADLMSSVKKNLGIHEDQAHLTKDLRAKGIAKMMVNVRSSYRAELTPSTLFEWHEMLMEGNRAIQVGTWRSGDSPMQVVSGAIGREIVHFEAPPSIRVTQEMETFIEWFNETAPGKPKEILNPLIRSGIVHLYFESIHPFEDGNGRIGRALAEKAIHQGLGSPTLISISASIEKDKNSYYKSLSTAQRGLEINDWLIYFGETLLAAQKESAEMVEFTIQKTRFFDRWKSKMNDRQMKVISRMLAEGPEGFEGGISAKKYMAIAKTSKATATRDLQSLNELGILESEGGGRSIRYQVNLN